MEPIIQRLSGIKDYITDVTIQTQLDTVIEELKQYEMENEVINKVKEMKESEFDTILNEIDNDTKEENDKIAAISQMNKEIEKNDNMDNDRINYVFKLFFGDNKLYSNYSKQNEKNPLAKIEAKCVEKENTNKFQGMLV